MKMVLTLWLSHMTRRAISGGRCLKNRYAANTLMSVKYCSQLRRMMVKAASTHMVKSWYCKLCILAISAVCLFRLLSSLCLRSHPLEL